MGDEGGSGAFLSDDMLGSTKGSVCLSSCSEIVAEAPSNSSEGFWSSISSMLFLYDHRHRSEGVDGSMFDQKWKGAHKTTTMDLIFERWR